MSSHHEVVREHFLPGSCQRECETLSAEHRRQCWQGWLRAGIPRCGGLCPADVVSDFPARWDRLGAGSPGDLILVRGTNRRV